MSRQGYLPTVLLVDDDPAATQYYRENFHRDTSVGVVVANTLSEGRRLVESEDIAIDAVLADLHFEVNTDDPEHELFDGVDFLAFSSARRPSTLSYALSFFASRDDHHKQAEKAGVSVRRWIGKSWYTGEEGNSPWANVERDLLVARWQEDKTIKQRLGELGIKVPKSLDKVAISEYVRELGLPIRTYLQDLAVDDMRITRPIEVMCVRIDSESVRVSAPGLGLLVDGEGETIDAALSHLAAIITDQQRDLDEEPDKNIVGYLKLVKDRMSAHIAHVE